jgi:hypothetical protein
VGKVNFIAEDHIGLLCFGYFRVSIPEHLMGARYVAELPDNCWFLASDPSIKIQVGDSIQFTVHR